MSMELALERDPYYSDRWYDKLNPDQEIRSSSERNSVLERFLQAEGLDYLSVKRETSS